MYYTRFVFAFSVLKMRSAEERLGFVVKKAKKTTKKTVAKKAGKKKTVKKASKKRVVMKKAASKKTHNAGAQKSAKKKTTKKKTVSKKKASVKRTLRKKKSQKRKSVLTAKELQCYRDLLIERLKEIVGNVNHIESEALKTSRQDSSGDLSSMPIHMADIGSDNYEQEFALGLMDSERKIVQEIYEALKRIQEGTYGICEGTGEPIPKARLDGIPWTRYCVKYAEMLEKGLVFAAQLSDEDEFEYVEDEDSTEDIEYDDEDGEDGDGEEDADAYFYGYDDDDDVDEDDELS